MSVKRPFDTHIILYKEREENMSEKIVVCLEKGGARDMAEAFSRRTNTPISEKPGEHLTVLFNSKGVSSFQRG